jgi:hypothetical protein
MAYAFFAKVLTQIAFQNKVLLNQYIKITCTSIGLKKTDIKVFLNRCWRWFLSVAMVIAIIS